MDPRYSLSIWRTCLPRSAYTKAFSRARVGVLSQTEAWSEWTCSAQLWAAPGDGAHRGLPILPAGVSIKDHLHLPMEWVTPSPHLLWVQSPGGLRSAGTHKVGLSGPTTTGAEELMTQWEHGLEQEQWTTVQCSVTLGWCGELITAQERRSRSVVTILLCLCVWVSACTPTQGSLGWRVEGEFVTTCE